MPTKVKQADETAIVWGSEAGDDEALTSESVADGAGRRGAIHDFGAAPRTDVYLVEFWAQFAATPTAGEVARLYIYEAGPTSSSTVDHNPTGGTTDADLSTEDDLRNADQIGSLIVRTASADTEFYMAPKKILVPSRHWGVVFWNATGASTTSDASETKVRVTPIPPEIQD